MRLEDKVAIVTGAGGGMGASEARLFAREGAKVVVADIWDEGGESVAASIEDAGGNARFVHCDVTQDDDWERLLQATVGDYGKLDILVNNAGLSSTSEDDPTSLEGWNRIMGVNATGVYLGTERAIPHMIESGGGSIVNISSIMGFVGSAGGHPAYHASKGAVRLFTKAIAVNYGPQGIRCNSVHPGFLPPMRSGGAGTEEARERAARITPLRRIGDPIDVANGVLFLASDEASFITGTELVIDGGFIAQ
jgi:NAD(P)-dependent dehydrogenase (short-subunit alcohol dehydrogenase family)